MATGHMHSVPPRRVLLHPCMLWQWAAGSLPHACAACLECAALHHPSRNPCPRPASHHLRPLLCCRLKVWTPACQLQAHRVGVPPLLLPVADRCQRHLQMQKTT